MFAFELTDEHVEYLSAAVHLPSPIPRLDFESVSERLGGDTPKVFLCAKG